MVLTIIIIPMEFKRSSGLACSQSIRIMCSGAGQERGGNKEANHLRGLGSIPRTVVPLEKKKPRHPCLKCTINHLSSIKGEEKIKPSLAVQSYIEANYHSWPRLV